MAMGVENSTAVNNINVTNTIENSNETSFENVTTFYNWTSSATSAIVSTMMPGMDNGTTAGFNDSTTSGILSTIFPDMDNGTTDGYNSTTSGIISTTFPDMDNGTTDSFFNSKTEDDYHGYQYDYSDYAIMYQGFSFERPIYLFVWEFLVILTSLVNIVVIFVLMRKNMRNVTNTILVAIAISDSLTGLVTLPSYIAVYQEFEPAHETNVSMWNGTDYAGTTPHYSEYDAVSMTQRMTEHSKLNGSYNNDHGLHDNVTVDIYDATSVEAFEGYALTKDLCRFFMISKFYVSKVLHTVSIWLTLFLGVHRYMMVAFPFKAQSLFNTKTTGIAIGVIVLFAPVLHIYHLVDDKVTEYGFCSWDIDGCKDGACVYLWFTIIFMHYIPCLLLVAFTCLFIKELRRGAAKVSKMGSISSSAIQKKRTEDTRRISIVVTTIVIVFLIPEIPYGVFLTYSTIGTQLNKVILPLESNRAFHVAYELLLVLSFHANFYIYTFLNKRFRNGLKKTFVYPIRKLIGKHQRMSVTGASSFGSRTQGKTSQSDCPSSTLNRATELQSMNSKEKNSNSNSVNEREQQNSTFIN